MQNKTHAQQITYSYDTGSHLEIDIAFIGFGRISSREGTVDFSKGSRGFILGG